MRKLQKGTTAGFGNVPAEPLRNGGEVVINILTVVCNKIWQIGEQRTSWVQSIIITLRKKGNLLQCGHYSTISLISHTKKVVLKILLNRLKLWAKEILEIKSRDCSKKEKTPYTKVSALMVYMRKIYSTNKNFSTSQTSSHLKGFGMGPCETQ